MPLKGTATSMSGMSSAVAGPCGKAAWKARAARAICVALCFNFRPKSASCAKLVKAFGDTPFDASRAARAVVSRFPSLASASARAAAMVAGGSPARLALSSALKMSAASLTVASSLTDVARNSAATCAWIRSETPASCASVIPAPLAASSARNAVSVSFAANVTSMRTDVNDRALPRTSERWVAFSGKPADLAAEAARITTSYSLALPLGSRAASANDFAALCHSPAFCGTRAFARPARSTVRSTQSTSAAERHEESPAS
mmetsp:Transcript_121051/g.349753  ORF Transcript_121051/g.349753 Transcript_121051/m.349753 type:complete len:260 (-) Transcript_121051:1331-2110(-)